MQWCRVKQCDDTVAQHADYPSAAAGRAFMAQPRVIMITTTNVLPPTGYPFALLQIHDTPPVDPPSADTIFIATRRRSFAFKWVDVGFFFLLFYLPTTWSHIRKQYAMNKGSSNKMLFRVLVCRPMVDD